MNVEIAQEENGWRYSTELGKECRYIRGKGRVGLRGTVNNCNDQGLGTRQFKRKGFK